MSDLDLWPRIRAAIDATNVSRAAAEWQWPTCHKKNCHGDHGNIDAVFAMFAEAIANSIHTELLCKATTEPDPPLGDVDAPTSSTAAVADLPTAANDSAPLGPPPEIALRALHAEIERLASTASMSYVSRAPLRVTPSGERIWFDDGKLVVLTAEGGVFWSVREAPCLPFWPDWEAESREYMCRLAHAIESACADVGDETDSASTETVS